MAGYFPFEFEAVIEHHDLGTMRYTVVFLPDEIVPQLPLAAYPRLRISGEIDGHPFTGAWQPVKGRWYLMLGKPLLKASGLIVGALASIRFRVEPQHEVDVPPALLAAIRANDEAYSRWAALTPGKQRALAHRVMSAKAAETASRRIAEVVAWLVRGDTDLRRLGKI